jgi:hypothetical protein
MIDNSPVYYLFTLLIIYCICSLICTLYTYSFHTVDFWKMENTILNYDCHDSVQLSVSKSMGFVMWCPVVWQDSWRWSTRSNQNAGIHLTNYTASHPITLTTYEILMHCLHTGPYSPSFSAAFNISAYIIYWHTVQYILFPTCSTHTWKYSNMSHEIQ